MSARQKIIPLWARTPGSEQSEKVSFKPFHELVGASDAPAGVDDEGFAEMFERSIQDRGGEAVLQEGEVVKGTVVQVTRDFVVVDVGYASVGQIPINEFRSLNGEIAVKAGDCVDVLLEARENASGMVVLSKAKADKLRIGACGADDALRQLESMLADGWRVASMSPGSAVNSDYSCVFVLLEKEE